jgi:hypothetical protein
MCFTGSGIEAASAAGDQSAAVADVAVPMTTTGGRRRWLGAGRDAGAAAAPDDLDAIRGTASWLIGQQAGDGHWRAPLEGDTILESEFILLLAWAGRLADPRIPGAIDRILALQLPTGGWAIHPDGAVDVSASVKAYFALKLVGHRPEEPALVRARAAIAAAGGPWAVNSFTRFYLALLGQMPYSACPAVPPEAVLLPGWFPVSLARVSAWSRTMIVPLSLMWAFKPRRSAAAGHLCHGSSVRHTQQFTEAWARPGPWVANSKFSLWRTAGGPPVFLKHQ